MRQFLLSGNVAYATDTNLETAQEGQIGVFYQGDDGLLKLSSTGKEFKGKGMIILYRSAENGGPVTIPVNTNLFSFEKGEYQESKKFKATVTLNSVTKVGDYSLIVALKGTKFNERNKWTAMVHVKDAMSGEDLAKELAKYINYNGQTSGVKASVSATTLTIEAEKAGVDYEVLGADELFGIDVTVTQKAEVAYGDAKYVQDLAEKAAADAGFEYTFRDAYTYLYPNYPLNPLAQPNAVDAGYTIFTLKFAEPRKVVTRDEVVNQIVQVAFPTGCAAISSFETVCKGLADIVAE